jgi:uncharacterized membrane protein YhaH (DUF805 family)
LSRKNFFFGGWFYAIIVNIPLGFRVLFQNQNFFTTLWLVWFILCTLFLFSLFVRRMHDVDGGTLFVILLIPFFPLLYLFLLFVKGGDTINEYGLPVVGQKFFNAIFPKE